MRFIARVALAATLLAALVAPPAQARQVEIQIGESLVCDTQEQVQRFAVLFDGDLQRTASAVNEEVKDPTACAVLAIARDRSNPHRHVPNHTDPGARCRDARRHPGGTAGRVLLDDAD